MEVRTIQDLRALVQGRRRALGLSQSTVAAQAGVSRKWLSDLESGKETVELGKVLALLDAIDVVLSATVADATAPEAGHGADLDTILADYRDGEQ